MIISDLFSTYRNHPILFIGAGFSHRYKIKSPSWDALLQELVEFYSPKNARDHYLTLKGESYVNGRLDMSVLASSIAKEFEEVVKKGDDSKYAEINKRYLDNIAAGNPPVSRIKYKIADIFSNTDLNPDTESERKILKKALRNISTIVTTNYDCLIEKLSGFTPVIGNDILDTQPYNSVYKIHGCVNHPDKIIITKNDYDQFRSRYQLISGQLLSLFIHHPVIFIGYSADDVNIRELLSMIFNGIDRNTRLYSKLRANFLLVNYTKGVDSVTIEDYDINLEGNTSIGIKQIKTDNFSSVYAALSDISVPVTVAEIKRVSSIVRDIEKGGTINVRVADDFDNLKPEDRVLAIGNITLGKQYVPLNISEIRTKYFTFIRDRAQEVRDYINLTKIPSSEYFPIRGFMEIFKDINDADKLLKQQRRKLHEFFMKNKRLKRTMLINRQNHNSVESILKDNNIKRSYKSDVVFCAAALGFIKPDNLKVALIAKKFCSTNYNRLLTLYDLIEYGGDNERKQIIK